MFKLNASGGWELFSDFAESQGYAAAILASRATADSVLEDAARLDWLGEDDGSHVIKVGKTWYTRPAFGHPHRKHKNLRAAIDAARAGGQVMYLQLKCFWCGERRRLGDDHFLWCSEYPSDAVLEGKQ